MRIWINYHHLLYFKVIAEQGSVSKAAEVLRLGQPTLSAQLKQFEENLGVQLFERSHKKLSLTEQGRLALEYAKNIFELGNEMYEVLHDHLITKRAHLQIGALDSIPKQILLQLTKTAYKLGNCQISVTEGRIDELIRELTAHRIDLIVSNFLPSGVELKRLYHRSIVKKPVSIYGTTKFKKLREGFPQSLQGQPVILPTYDSKLRYDLEHWCKNRSILFDVLADTQDIALKKLMAIDGIALFPAAAHTVTRQVLSGDLIEIGRLDGIYEELFILRAHRKRSHPLAAALMDKFSV